MLRRIALPSFSIVILFAAAALRAEEKTEEKTSVFVPPIFCYQSSENESKSGFLDIGLAKVYSHEINEDRSRLDLIKAPFVELFSYKGSPDGSKVKFVDVGPVGLLEMGVKDEGETHAKFADLWLTSLYEQRLSEKATERKVLTFPILGSLFRQKNNEDGREIDLLYFIRIKSNAAPREAEPADAAK